MSAPGTQWAPLVMAPSSRWQNPLHHSLPLLAPPVIAGVGPGLGTRPLSPEQKIHPNRRDQMESYLLPGIRSWAWGETGGKKHSFGWNWAWRGCCPWSASSPHFADEKPEARKQQQLVTSQPLSLPAKNGGLEFLPEDTETTNMHRQAAWRPGCPNREISFPTNQVKSKNTNSCWAEAPS